MSSLCPPLGQLPLILQFLQQTFIHSLNVPLADIHSFIHSPFLQQTFIHSFTVPPADRPPPTPGLRWASLLLFSLGELVSTLVFNYFAFLSIWVSVYLLSPHHKLQEDSIHGAPGADMTSGIW